LTLFEYEFVINLGVNGGMQKDWIKAPTGGQAQKIMEARYPQAQNISIIKITRVEDTK
jgi:hypothetical protein